MTPPATTQQCNGRRTLPQEPRILDRLGEVLHQMGLVGEERAAKLLYLALTSRVFERPVSVAVKGVSSGGKSFTVETVLRLFPDAAFYELTAMSERALAYDEEPLAHRHLIIFEAAGMEGDFASYLLRTLLSEGKLAYVTVEKTKGGMQARRIEREGPTGLIVTTTRHRLHPENETRLLSVPVCDTPAQTHAVMVALADAPQPEPELADWIGFQETIVKVDVKVPFARALAELIPPAATRLRRDFGAILGLIRAHALLHRVTRPKVPGGILATVEDYAAIRELVADLVSEGVGQTVRPETRETVAAVSRLSAGKPEGVPLAALAATLDLDKSTVSRRTRAAREDGYLVNLEDRRGRPARYQVGDPLPDELEILPAPEELEATVAPLHGEPGGNNGAGPEEGLQ